jgi:hypothetical protein
MWKLTWLVWIRWWRGRPQPKLAKRAYCYHDRTVANITSLCAYAFMDTIRFHASGQNDGAGSAGRLPDKRNGTAALVGEHSRLSGGSVRGWRISVRGWHIIVTIILLIHMLMEIRSCYAESFDTSKSPVDTPWPRHFGHIRKSLTDEKNVCVLVNKRLLEPTRCSFETGARTVTLHSVVFAALSAKYRNPLRSIWRWWV